VAHAAGSGISINLSLVRFLFFDRESHQMFSRHGLLTLGMLQIGKNCDCCNVPTAVPEAMLKSERRCLTAVFPKVQVVMQHV
jgi:hypothetical protein